MWKACRTNDSVSGNLSGRSICDRDPYMRLGNHVGGLWVVVECGRSSAHESSHKQTMAAAMRLSCRKSLTCVRRWHRFCSTGKSNFQPDEQAWCHHRIRSIESLWSCGNNHMMSCRSMSSSTKHARQSQVKGMLTLDQFRKLVEKAELETVIVAMNDCYGRMVGKRYTADFFLSSAVEDGTHACSYLLATDMDMEPVRGYKYAGWEQGYGDIHLVPDLNTLRVASWLKKTALVLCDVVDDSTHQLETHAPRTILRQQIKAAEALGSFVPMAASELEYFLYRDTYEEAKDKNYAKLKPAGWHREDYHILQGTREEFFHGPARYHLEASGVPVENSKGEFGLGQHELNVKYSDILEMADRHVVYKQCLKELADSLGVSVTFMAKPDASQPGSSSHIHLSLWKEGNNIFPGDEQLGSISCSPEFRWFLGGWMKHSRELMVFYAPTVNSYKRFIAGSWAPTQIAWYSCPPPHTRSPTVVGELPLQRLTNWLWHFPQEPRQPNNAVPGAGIREIHEDRVPPPRSRLQPVPRLGRIPGLRTGRHPQRDRASCPDSRRRLRRSRPPQSASISGRSHDCLPREQLRQDDAGGGCAPPLLPFFPHRAKGVLGGRYGLGTNPLLRTDLGQQSSAALPAWLC